MQPRVRIGFPDHDAAVAALAPRQDVTITYTREDGSTGEFSVLARVDGPTELNYLRNGGILQTVVRRLYREG